MILLHSNPYPSPIQRKLINEDTIDKDPFYVASFSRDGSDYVKFRNPELSSVDISYKDMVKLIYAVRTPNCAASEFKIMWRPHFGSTYDAADIIIPLVKKGAPHMDHHIEFRASHQQPIKKYVMKSMETAAKKADLEGRGFDLSQIVVNGECDHPKTNGKCCKKYRVSNASHDFVLFKAGK